MTRRKLLLETFEDRILCSVTAPTAVLVEPQNHLIATAGHATISGTNAAPPAPEGGATALAQDAQPHTAREVIFINSDLSDGAQLVAELTKDHADRSFEVVTLDAHRDGVAQITEFLAASGTKFDAIHLLAHGEAGEVTLGATRLDGSDIGQFADEIAQWRGSLNSGADVLFYGCSVAGNDAGKAVLQRIAGLTGADVAASTDLTGAAALGGNWTLEFATGAIQDALGAAPGESVAWNHLLGPITISGPASVAGTEDTTRVFSAANGNAIVISDPDGGLETATLSVQHGTLTLGGTTNLTFITGDGTADATMTFHGTAVDINAALDGLTFTPVADYFGPAQLNLTASDLASVAPNLANGGFEQPAGVATFQFYPEGTVDGWDTSAADGLIEIWHTGYLGVPAFEGSQFAEINATQSSTLSQVISPQTGGVLKFAFAHRGRAGVDTMNVTAIDLGADGVLGGGDDTVLLNENFSDGNTTWGYYERTLNSATGNPVVLDFTSVSTASGDQSIGNFVDGVFFGVPDGADSIATTINLAPVADIVDDNATTPEETPVAISVLANDTFENPGRTITAVDGNAIVANGPAVAVANGTVVLNGSEQLIFTPATDFNGPATFTYSVTSNGATETGNVNVNVTPVNDAPTIDLDGTTGGTGYATTYIENGTGTPIVGASGSVADVDSATLASATAVLTNAQPGDVLAIAGALPVGMSATIDNSVAGKITVTITGAASPAAYQTALQQIGFSNSTQNPATVTRSISVTVNDGALDSNTAVSAIDVVAVNDAPTISLPAPQSVAPGASLAITGISFGDVDAGGSTVTVTLAVSGGTLNVATGVGGGVTGGQVSGNGTGTVTLTGTLAAINATLADSAGLTFTNGTSGGFALTATVSDGGNSGVDPSTLGQPNTGTATDEQASSVLSLTVTPPALSVGDVAVTEGTSPYAVFTVTLGNPSANPVTFDLALVAGTAKAGADFSGLEVSNDGGGSWSPATSATIAAGEASVLVRTAITDDTVFENTETFSLSLTNAVNASIADGTAVATISDNDVRQATVSIVGTSDAGSTGANVVPGEVVTYELRLELAEGANAGVTLQDLLPAGMRFLPNAPVVVAYENAASITGLAAGTYSNLTADALISSSLTTNDDTYGNGTNVFFKLGDLTNNDSDPEREFVTVRFDAVVANTPANQAGTGLGNDVAALLDTNGDSKPGYVSVDGDGDNLATGGEVSNDPLNDGSGTAGLAGAVNATVAEPILVLDKQITSAPPAIKAGDTIIYTVTLSHGLGSGGTAWNATLADAVPAGLQIAQIDSVTLAGGAQEQSAAAIGGGGASLGGAWDIPLGGSVTVVYRATVTSAAVVGSTLNNLADLTWTSLTAPSADSRGSGNGLLGAGGLNDYELQAGAPATIDSGASDFTLHKQVIGDSNAQIGERLTYQLTLNVADGIVNGISLHDLLPAGFALVNGSAQFTAGSGVTVSGASFTYASNQLTLDIAQLQSAVDGAENTITITYQADVLNVPANDALGGPATAVKTNLADASYDPGSGPVTAQDSATVNVVEPVLDVTKSVDDTTPHLGQTVTYTVVITHDGTSSADAFDLTLNDALPPGVSLNAASIQLTSAPVGTTLSSTSVDGGPLALGLNQLALGQSATITFTATVSSDPAIVGGTFGGGDDTLGSTLALGYDSQPGGNANQRAGSNSVASSLTVVGGDLAVTMDDGQVSANAGGRLIYTITVTNNGTDAATNVVVTDTLPASDATFNAGLSTAGATLSGGKVIYNIPSLAAGATQTFTVVVDLATPTSAGLEAMTNVVSATQDDVEPTPSDNTESDTNTLTSVPDYQVSVTDNRTSAKPGDTIEYVITVKNVGNQNGTGVIVSDAFATGIFSAVVADHGGQVDLANGSVVWTVGNLDAGDTVTLTLRGTVKSSFASIPVPIGTLPGQVPDNNAIASAFTVTDDGTGGSEPSPADNTASDFDDLQPVAKLKITTSDGVLIAHPGQKLTYTIVATNEGTQDSNGTIVTSRLPPGTRVLAIASSDPALTGTPEISKGIIVWHFTGPLPAGEAVTFHLAVRVAADVVPGSKFTGTATITDDGTYGPDAENAAARFARDTDRVPTLPDPVRPARPVPAPKPASPVAFAFDAFHDFSAASNPLAGRLLSVTSIDLSPAPILPLMPIYSGAAEPGATLVISVYNSRGERIGSQTVLADAGGNWLATFPSTNSRDLPSTVEITQLTAPYGPDVSGGHNLRTYFSPAIEPGHFFFEAMGGGSGIGDEMAPLLGGLGLENPLRLGAAKYGGELLGASSAASGY